MWTQDNFQAHDGQTMIVNRLSTGSTLPHLHFAHATGLNANAYRRLLELLQDEFQVWAWDMRGHGLNHSVAGKVDSWVPYYADLVCLLEHIGEPTVLAGHSIGGMTSLAAAAKAPQLATGLLMLDPVLMLGRLQLGVKLAQLIGQNHRLPLAQMSANRRSEFDSREQAFEQYKGRGIFKSFPDSWLTDYLETGLIDADGKVQLACKPEFESSAFANPESSALRKARGVACPITVIAAERGSTVSTTSEWRFKRRFPDAKFIRPENSSHMVPMEHPQTVRDEILALRR